MKKKTRLTVFNLAMAIGGMNSATRQGKLNDDWCPAMGSKILEGPKHSTTRNDMRKQKILIAIIATAALRVLNRVAAVACWGWLAVVASAAPIPGLFNTGVDNNGNLLPDGAVDPHYTIIASDDRNFPCPTAFVVGMA